MIDHLTLGCIAVGGLVFSAIGAYFWGSNDGTEAEHERMSNFYAKVLDGYKNALELKQNAIGKLEGEITRITLEARGEQATLQEALVDANRRALENAEYAEAYKAVCRGYKVPMGELSGYINVLQEVVKAATIKKGEKSAKTKRRRKA